MGNVMQEFKANAETSAAYEAARDKCEEWCKTATGCWGCSVDAQPTHAQWNAIPACGTELSWTGRISGDITQKQAVLNASNMMLYGPDQAALSALRVKITSNMSESDQVGFNTSHEAAVSREDLGIATQKVSHEAALNASHRANLNNALEEGLKEAHRRAQQESSFGANVSVSSDDVDSTKPKHHKGRK